MKFSFPQVCKLIFSAIFSILFGGAWHRALSKKPNSAYTFQDVCACLCSSGAAALMRISRGACGCAGAAPPRRGGGATVPSGEEIECEVQYSLGPSSVAVAQQLVH